MRTRSLAAATPLLLLVAITGCSSEAPDSSTPPPAPSSSEVANVEDRDAAEPDPADEDAILDAAAAAFEAYAQPELDYATWWAGLSPLLHPNAVEAYSTVLPANIPVDDVGEPTLFSTIAGESHAVVEFDTNDGVWLVEVRRFEGAWLASRFTPPQP